MLQDLSLIWLVATAVTAFVLHYLWDRFFSLHGLPWNLPWAGAADTSAIARAGAVKRSFFGLREAIQDGYYKFSKRDRPFILPNLATGPEVILPWSQMKWLLEQPDNVLSQNEVNRQFLHADRTMLHPNIIRDTVHGRVIRREMTKDLDNYAEAIVEEIEHELNRKWGQNTSDWSEVPVYDTMLDVTARISNRVLVGLPLCRNDEYLRSTSTFARNVVITAGMINLLPATLRPLLAPIITAYDMYHYRQIAKHIYPIVEERMRDFKPGMDYRTPDYSKHNDYIQWALHDAFSHDDPAERTPEMITKRLTVLSFAAIQSSVITITNALFDIASSSKSSEFQHILREEVASVTRSKHLNERWKQASLASMVRIDSALRESMRLWGFISRGVMKKVVAPEGVTIPSGDHLPCGAKVGVTAYAIHHDESVYKNAYEYDALRFSDHRDEVDKLAQLALVTSSDHFMAFSHGRHACPGRFFAANQLKLLLAQIVTKYDIEAIDSRPPNPWLNNSIGPPIWSKLRIRRRPGTVPIAAGSEILTTVTQQHASPPVTATHDFASHTRMRRDSLSPVDLEEAATPPKTVEEIPKADVAQATRHTVTVPSRVCKEAPASSCFGAGTTALL